MDNPTKIKDIWGDEAMVVGACLGHQGQYEGAYVARLFQDGDIQVAAAFSDNYSTLLTTDKQRVVLSTLDIEMGERIDLIMESNGNIRRLSIQFDDAGIFTTVPQEDILAPNERDEIKTRLTEVRARTQPFLVDLAI